MITSTRIHLQDYIYRNTSTGIHLQKYIYINTSSVVSHWESQRNCVLAFSGFRDMFHHYSSLPKPCFLVMFLCEHYKHCEIAKCCPFSISSVVKVSSFSYQIVNRPGVAGAVLQSPPSLINSLIHLLSDPLVKISSKHTQSQTGRARELKF